ncbi:MAG: LytTR family transcriptional regulator DNA-binding domain-containing protein [Desulfuromonadales bacterium]|nr:LytTR family transcriptional regulator DNA-binding domain-containing protein [Desulfuromonadales bacterium]
MGTNSILSTIEQIEPGVVILNQDRSVSHINHVFMLLFSDISLEQLFQGDILEIHRPESRERVREMLRLAAEVKRQVPTTLRFIRNDDKDRYILIKLIPLVDRDLAEQKISVLFYDITPYITTEQKLMRVPVSSHGEIHLLNPHDIVYFKADNIYTTVRTKSGEYHCALSLGAVEKRLSRDIFHRVHRSYLINIDRVHKILRETNECAVDVAGGEVHIPISRDKMQEFLTIVGLK